MVFVMATSIKLDDDLKDRVHMLAQQRDRSSHWIMREAIRTYVEREEKREELKKQVQQVWKSYETDGLHLTFEEADKWLDKLSKGEEMDIPKCHN